jgi:hypothetical protein
LKNSAPKNSGSGQLSHRPCNGHSRSTLRRFAFGRAGRCRDRYCGRPFSRRILSSLHREPDRRKRNAHCLTFRQSLHCLIVKPLRDMHLGFLLLPLYPLLQLLGIGCFSAAAFSLSNFNCRSMRVFTLGRGISLTGQAASSAHLGLVLTSWQGRWALLPRNGRARTSSFCIARRPG